MYKYFLLILTPLTPIVPYQLFSYSVPLNSQGIAIVPKGDYQETLKGCVAKICVCVSSIQYHHGDAIHA